MQPTDHSTEKTVWYNLSKDFRNGALLGIGVSLLNPFFYAKNMRLIGAPFHFRHCFRGTGINAITGIPQAAVQISTLGLMKKILFSDQTFGQTLLVSSVAGALSGMTTVPVELVVQNIQKSGHEGYHTQRVVRDVVRINGIRGLFAGSGALMTREVVYVASYYVVAERISSIFAASFGQSRWTEVMGAGISGAVGGAVSTPLDYLRGLKQDQAVKRRPENYRTIISRAGLSTCFRGVMERSLAVALACIVMNQGSKLLIE